MKGKYVWIILLVLSVILLLPPIVHGYIYPNGGDDTSHHLIVMEQVKLADPIPHLYLYAGQWMVGYPLIIMRDYLHISLPLSFMWFNYLALVGALFSIYFVCSKMFGKVAGLLTAVVAVFAAQIILEQFLAGLIFNLINMSIIFIWLAYFTVTGIVRRNWKRGMVAVLLAALFVNFHATGNYIAVLGAPFVIGSPGTFYSITEKIKQGLTIFNHVSSADMMNYIQVATGIFAVAGIGFYFAIKEWRKNKEVSLFVILLSILCAGLVVIACPILTISPVPVRQLQDAINLAVIIGGFLLGLWLRKVEFNTGIVVAVVVILSVVLVLPNWLFRDNSAIKPVDRQAINYINTLSEKGFYGNEYLSSNIYGRYINKLYEPGSGVYIWRSIPMTMMTNPTTDLFWNPDPSNVQLPVNIKSIRYFTGGGITIYVAEANP